MDCTCQNLLTYSEPQEGEFNVFYMGEWRFVDDFCPLHGRKGLMANVSEVRTTYAPTYRMSYKQADTKGILGFSVVRSGGANPMTLVKTSAGVGPSNG